MEKQHYKTKTVKLNDISFLNGEYKLKYYILISNYEIGNGIFKKIYGIEVVKEYTDNIGNYFSQSRDIRLISHRETEIYDIAELAFTEGATPTSIDKFVNLQLDKNSFSNSNLQRNFA